LGLDRGARQLLEAVVVASPQPDRAAVAALLADACLSGRPRPQVWP